MVYLVICISVTFFVFMKKECGKMFSNMKQTFYHVRDSLIKHRWLLTAELIWMIVCTFWTVSEQEKMYQFYHLSASTIDYVIAQQGTLYSGLTIFPFVLFS